MKKSLRFARILLLVLAVLCFAGCSEQAAGSSGSSGSTAPSASSSAPTQPPVTQVTMVVTEQTIAQLEELPHLQKADLTGSTCYGAILAYQKTHPQVEVIYTVDLGGTTVKNDATLLELAEGSYDYDALLENLQYLPKVDSLRLFATERTAQQLQTLQQTYPDVSLVYTVEILDVEYAPDVVTLNLSGLKSEELEATVAKFPLFSQLIGIELVPSEGSCALTPADVKILRQALPQAAIRYEFDLFGQTVSTSETTSLTVKNVILGPNGQKMLREALDILWECTYLMLENCNVDLSVINALKAEYPHIKLEYYVPPTVPGTSGKPVDKDKVEELTQVVTDETISELEQYKNLREIDLSGSTCYGAILDYMARYPHVIVHYTVPLGGEKPVGGDSYRLILPEGGYDYAAVLENLKYLPKLAVVSLPDTLLNGQQLKALEEAYPHISFRYSMAAQSGELNDQILSADLSYMTAEELQSMVSQLLQLPNIRYVELMKADGTSNLSIADVKYLQENVPNVVFHYSFQLFGKTVSTTDAVIEYINVSIGNQGEAAIREALDILTGCTYFKLDNCGLDNDVVAAIREDYPRTEVVWRLFHANNRSWLTDTEVLRAVYHVTNSNCHLFKYLTKVKYMDLGHNESLSDLSFISYMPDLEIAILSGAPITDLSPLSGCKKLYFLELGYCGRLWDVTPLEGCTGLRYLNIGFTGVRDISALKDLPLDRLMWLTYKNYGFTEAQKEAVYDAHPDCWVTFSNNSDFVYGYGWRYDSPNEWAVNWSSIYLKVREVFNLDYVDSLIQGGAK